MFNSSNSLGNNKGLRRRKRKNKNKSSDLNPVTNNHVLQKIAVVDIFLQDTNNDVKSSITTVENSNSNKGVFDTLSDVSTDDSDLEIINITDIKSSKCPKPSESKESLDYLTKPPICVIKQTNFRSTIMDKELSTDSSSSDENKEHTMLDNGLSFIIDGVSSIAAKNKDQPSSSNTEGTKTKRKRKSQKRFPDNPELRLQPRMFKYWSQRYDLFERFDMGIKLDRESWFSVTPEYIAKEQAELCLDSDTVIDGFCGAGGNAIQFGYRCQKVYAIDIDQSKVALTRNNCSVYGLKSDKVTVINDDFHHFASLYTSENPDISFPDISVVFLSPPWGGQDYLITEESKSSVFDLSSIAMDRLMASARCFRARMIMVFLPRNTDMGQLQTFALANETVTLLKHGSRYKSQGTNKIKAVTVVFQ